MLFLHFALSLFLRERLHELTKGKNLNLISALKLGDLLHTGPKSAIKKGTLRIRSCRRDRANKVPFLAPVR